MKETFSGKSRFVRLMRGRGVYVALAASVLAFGGVAVAMLGQELFHSEPGGESSLPPDEMVEQIVTNQPANRTPTTTTPSRRALTRSCLSSARISKRISAR